MAKDVDWIKTRNIKDDLYTTKKKKRNYLRYSIEMIKWSMKLFYSQSYSEEEKKRSKVQIMKFMSIAYVWERRSIAAVICINM